MFFLKWQLKKKGEFLQQTGECLIEGYPLHLAVIIQTYHAKSYIKEEMNHFLEMVKEGMKLDQALAQIGIPEDICQFIFYAGEAGTLANGFVEGGKMLLKQNQSKEIIQKVLRYPLFLLWIFCLLFFFLTKYLFPNFIQLYQSLSIKLPMITRLLMNISKHMTLYIILLIVLFLLAALLFFLFFYRLSPILRFRLLIRIPYVSRMVQLYLTQYLAFHLGSLMKSGLTMNQAILIMKGRRSSVFFRQEAENLYWHLKEGGDFSGYMKQQSFYLPDFHQIIFQGEHNGMLGQMLYRYGLRLLKKMEQQLNALLKSLQPAVLIIVGILVLVLFLSIMIPVFNIMNGL